MNRKPGRLPSSPFQAYREVFNLFLSGGRMRIRSINIFNFSVEIFRMLKFIYIGFINKEMGRFSP